MRGFHSTYNLHGCSNVLDEIVTCHDSSGEYPLSAPDFPEEKGVVDAGRMPLDGFHKTIITMFPSELSESDEYSVTTSPASSTPSLPSRTNTPVSVDNPSVSETLGLDSARKIKKKQSGHKMKP